MGKHCDVLTSLALTSNDRALPKRAFGSVGISADLRDRNISDEREM